jgi:hypothetical protein
VLSVIAAGGVLAVGLGLYWTFYPSWAISVGDSEEHLRRVLGPANEEFTDPAAFRKQFHSDWHWHRVDTGEQLKARELPTPSGIALHYSSRLFPYLVYVDDGRVADIYWMTAD